MQWWVLDFPGGGQLDRDDPRILLEYFTEVYFLQIVNNTENKEINVFAVYQHAHLLGRRIT